MTEWFEVDAGGVATLVEEEPPPCTHPNLELEWVLGVGRTRYCPDCGKGW